MQAKFIAERTARKGHSSTASLRRFKSSYKLLPTIKNRDPFLLSPELFFMDRRFVFFSEKEFETFFKK